MPIKLPPRGTKLEDARCPHCKSTGQCSCIVCPACKLVNDCICE